MNFSPKASLSEDLLSDRSKEYIESLAQYIAASPGLLKELIDLFLGPSKRVSQRASWALSKIHDAHPKLIMPYLPQLVKILSKTKNNAVRRNTVRILQDVTLPKKLHGPVIDLCFKLLNDKKEDIAVKVFSMSVLGNLTLIYPEIRSELKESIEIQIPTASAGFLSRSKKVLKQINRSI